MSKLRLLKVIVQPIFAIDDGETLTETPADPVVVRPGDWPTYPTTQFVDAVDALAVQLDAEVLPVRRSSPERLSRGSAISEAVP